MIITVTCNPAIDKTVFENNTVFDYGGKGINVAKVLHNLNTKCLCTGFIGKGNCDEFYKDLDSLNIDYHFIEVEGKVRTNTKTIIEGKLIEENEDGPYIDEESVNKLIEYLKTFKNEIVIISGSVPKNVDRKIYLYFIEELKKNNNYVILDGDNLLLKYGIEGKPDVIKPNKDEICRLFDITYDKDTVIDKCKDLGIELICLSLGEDGALFIHGDDVYECEALDIECRSSVGAGDSMSAAIAYGKANDLDIIETIKLAMAAASAACMQEGTKPGEFNTIMKLKTDVKYLKR